jgi:hypothetical protein
MPFPKFRPHPPKGGARWMRGVPYRLHFVYTQVMASSDTTTVRVRRPDSERLAALAESRQTTVVEVVHTAIDALERQEFMRGLNDDYRRLDLESREALLTEQLEWDPLA